MGVQLDAGGGRKRGIAPNINVTPLVDVVLVLLIIFMVVIPNMQDGKTIELLKVTAADKVDTENEPITLTVDRAEVCTYEKVDMSKDQCMAALRQAWSENPRRRVLLRGDATLPYRVMRGYFHEAQQIGFAGVSLAVGVGREWSSEES
ncbi:MAG: biopolymer transporter ExbD [Deltaproteobacteria bacterium]|nr:biopolymer transporter ExbD [Deltaproteobacteria bacterium]MBK8235055.1 biopolymer transporter ExbD [Deltaproteobacteria bacterium]MBK8716631.1 biopolymer transporter ExbD [Deltaproteobacteria bacterium]MBP7290190.1 biopolymer transporter ExbD [Nannocystaceae bacterium]